MLFNGIQSKCGVEIDDEGDVMPFSDCCGCGDVLDEETARGLTRALMARFGITEAPASGTTDTRSNA